VGSCYSGQALGHSHQLHPPPQCLTLPVVTVPATASAGGSSQLGVPGGCHGQPVLAAIATSPAFLVAPVSQVAHAPGIYLGQSLLEAMPARSCD